jgi:hypothetical protein
VKGWGRKNLLKGVGQIDATDLSNSTVAVALQQFHYMTAKGFVIEQKAANVINESSMTTLGY